jgi:hypothetical protein
MKKTAVAAVALAGTAALSGATLVPGAAEASSKATVMHLVLHETGTHSLSKYTFGGTDVARTRGKVVGYDAITGRFHPATNTVDVDVAFATRGGLILLHVSQSADEAGFRGKIFGGTGKYAGATGTVRGHSAAGDDTKTFVTLRLL